MGSEVPAVASVYLGMTFFPARWRPDHATTALLLTLPASPTPAGAVARRMAELLELHELTDEAVPWWQLAAAFGDPDARDYLRVL
ncbi:hypothetical protein ACQEVZ_60660 [Dactylosporangium sp. CA-152071]|uniref:hypothetical protein n=1 Tax=Dactylosporangium sp. CA-152071 TaxID=3239933 RepID=UPI003D8BE20E